MDLDWSIVLADAFSRWSIGQSDRLSRVATAAFALLATFGACLGGRLDLDSLVSAHSSDSPAKMDSWCLAARYISTTATKFWFRLFVFYYVLVLIRSILLYINRHAACSTTTIACSLNEHRELITVQTLHWDLFSDRCCILSFTCPWIPTSLVAASARFALGTGCGLLKTKENMNQQRKYHRYDTV
jgi:hypothetical protein